MIENTSQRDPMLHLLGAMGDRDGLPGYITGMEADGQRQVVASQAMPIDGPWDKLAELGFVVGGTLDDLFRKATLPEGWSKQGSDHAMWSYILDERGIRRVAIFYKAAFYDRSAHCHIENVGGAASSHALYGDDPAALPDKWDLFNPDLVAVQRETELLGRAYNRRRDALVLLAEEAASGYAPGAPLHDDYKVQLAGILPWLDDDKARESFDGLTRLAGQRFDAAQFADAWPAAAARDALVEAEDELRKAAISMVRADDLTPRR